MVVLSGLFDALLFVSNKRPQQLSWRRNGVQVFYAEFLRVSPSDSSRTKENIPKEQQISVVTFVMCHAGALKKYWRTSPSSANSSFNFLHTDRSSHWRYWMTSDVCPSWRGSRKRCFGDRVPVRMTSTLR